MSIIRKHITANLCDLWGLSREGIQVGADGQKMSFSRIHEKQVDGRKSYVRSMKTWHSEGN